ncbi:MAG: nucleotidyltransferase domain-containing protein [Clostridia bacterium]|nr:nucleotidyltransferase domain-containing protein [Clostridia bacterium]
MVTISDISQAINSVADKYSIKKIMLFGSYAEGTNTPTSDVDLLVEFNSDCVSLLTIASLKIELEEVLHIDVDIIRLPIPENALIKPEKVVPIYAA